MTLPACNPIDYGWFAKGTAIDHVGTVKFQCKVCDDETTHEKFLIVVGSQVGFGAPFFAKPFLKHSSTKGKMGGVRGLVVQCRSCNSLWAFDATGTAALQRGGLPPELIARDRANDYRNRLAKNEEDSRKAPQAGNQSEPFSNRVEKFRE